MSFPDPAQPSSLAFMPLPFAGGDGGGFWPQVSMNNEHLDLQRLQSEYTPPFKRPRNTEHYPPNSAPFSPINQRNNQTNPPMNKGTTHIFFKTRMCMKFTEGNCRNGESCTFAHGAEELRQPPPNWQELVGGKDRGAGSWNEDQRIIHRMKICKKFYIGEECPYGDSCNFLHEGPTKLKTYAEIPRESSAISIAVMGHGSGSDQSENNKHVNSSSDAFSVNNMKMKPVFWKTRLCSKWEATGQCPFGERCHFAHGQAELQLPGSRIEAEVMSTGSIPVLPLSVPANDVSPPKPAAFALAKDDGEGKKCFGKWKGQKKINRIYADWIDDLKPPHVHPSMLDC